MCKKMPLAKKANKAAQMADSFLEDEIQDDFYDQEGFGYGYNSCNGGQDVVSSIFYQLNAQQMMEEQHRIYLEQQRQYLASQVAKAPLNVQSQAFRPTFVPVISSSDWIGCREFSSSRTIY